VLANFAKAIEARQAAGQTMTTTLVSIDAADIVDARVTGGVASVAVKFAAKLASATMDRTGAVIDGSTTSVGDHLDIWTFARTLGARDPNWMLAATETVH
jgi:predicted lipid-binding transport protein (Tim44 family)